MLVTSRFKWRTIPLPLQICIVMECEPLIIKFWSIDAGLWTLAVIGHPGNWPWSRFRVRVRKVNTALERGMVLTMRPWRFWSRGSW